MNEMKSLVLHGDETVIEPHPDQKTLTEQFTAEAVKFVRAKRDRPFFLYLPHGGRNCRGGASAGPDHRWEGYSPADDQARGDQPP
jgi:hypothetical protein